MFWIDYQFSNASFHGLQSLTNNAIKYKSYAIQIVFLRSEKFSAFIVGSVCYQGFLITVTK